MDLAHLNELVQLFGEYEKAAIRAEKRHAMTSALFDLPRRSALGWFFKYDHTAELMREVVAALPPEELGARMKLPGSRPYHMQHFLLFQDYLNARQQLLLEHGLADGEPYPDDRVDELAFVADVWERSSRAYRNDGLLVPEQAGYTMPVLADETLAAVRTLLEPMDAARYAEARRLLATFESYAFLAHGEQRDGLFGHGPYDGGDGRVLFFKEVNDLTNDFLPWAQTPTRNAHANIVFAYLCRDARIRCDFFGGLVTDPLELGDRIERFAVLTQEGGVVSPIPREAWSEISERAATATQEMWLDVVDWPAEQRAGYGAYLFANHLKPFLDLAGIDANARLARAAEDSIERHLGRLLEGPAVPAAMVHWGTTEGPFFFRVSG